jgi:hypothetical protein
MEKKGFRGVRNVNGRPRGVGNKVTKEAKDVLASFVSGELEYLQLYMDSLKVKDRLELLIKLLPYVMPKQSYIELDAQVESYQFTPVTIIANEPIKLQKDETEN